MKFSHVICCVLSASALIADQKKEEPVGLILSAAGSKVLRADTETPLAARVGDILFTGDALRTETGAASFLYCPAKASESLAPGSEVLFDVAKLKIRSGKLTDTKPVASCFLPQLVRVAVASQQHYGVSMTRGLTKPDETPVPHDKLDSVTLAELAPFEKTLAANPDDQGAMVGLATVYEKHKFDTNAVATYKTVAAKWKDAVWVRGKIFDLEESLAAAAALAAAAVPADARTFGLLIGISKYQKLPQEQWLQYAHADASVFAQHLRSARGGGVPEDNLLVLTDEQATLAAIRNGFQTFLKNRATKKDTVFIMVAGHGIVNTKGAYILAHDSDTQDLASTGLPMDEIKSLVQKELSKVGRVVLLADVCRAGAIGAIRGLKENTINSAVEGLGEAEGEMLGLLAGRPKEVSREGPEFGGGHGAFSYYVLKGLQGMGDRNDDQAVDAGEIIEYTRTQVANATQNRQHPRDFGNMANETKLSDLKKPGIQLARWPVLQDARYGGPLYLAQNAAQTLSSQAAADIQALQTAIAAGQLLPTDPNSAFAILAKLKSEVSTEQYFLQENRLRIALENRGQQVLLRYLTGDQVPQTKSDFQSGAQYMQAAAQLTPESLYLEGRTNFFQGRSMLFDKSYPQAANLLEQSVRIDPSGAYGYNALGIAYLEQAEYRKAIPAFKDAIKRAPHWSYPVANLALAYREIGDSRSAIRSYQQAMNITPQYSYLPYNLGLVYQRMNRRKDAEVSYRKAMSLAPDAADPLNALGSLKASEGKSAEAEKLYRQSLEKNPKLLAARQNLALLLASKQDRQTEAVDLWRANLQQQEDYLPSRISLAEALATRGDTRGAIEQYQQVVKLKPDYVAARIALAEQFAKATDPESALQQLREAARLDPETSSIFERIGDLESARSRAAEAKAAYDSALQQASDNATRKRIRAKMVK